MFVPGSRARRLLVWALVCSGLPGVFGSGNGYAADEPASPLARLVAAVGTWRPVEGRLSVDLGYAKYDPKASPSGDPLAIALAAAAIESAAAREPNPSALHALGLLRLIERRPADAVTTLSEVVEQDHANAAAWSDLAAAYLARARAAEDTHDAVRALEAAEAAVSLAPELPAARFNDALCLEAVALRAAARETWDAVATSDPGTAWRADARARSAASVAEERDSAPAVRAALEDALSGGDLASLSSIARRHPDLVGRIAREEWLGRWGAAVLDQRADEATRLITAIRTVARETSSVQDDAFLSECAAGIDDGLRSPEALLRLARGLKTFGAAIPLYRAFEIERAEPLLEAARSDLAEHPLGRQASFYLAMCRYWHAAYPAALTEFQRLRDSESPVHRTLKADETRMVGLLLSLTGRPVEARGQFKEALQRYDADRKSVV